MFILASRMASASASAFSRIRAENMKRQALRGLRADAGQMLQLVDQPFDGFGEIRHEIIFR